MRIWKLEHRSINDSDSDVSVNDDIIRALSPIHDDYYSAMKNAVRRQIPHSQFIDEYPQPETVLIRHRDSNRGHDHPCYLPCTLRLQGLTFILFATTIDGVTVDWGAINNFPTRPLSSDAFHSLSSLHLNFPSSAQHDRPSHDRPSQNNTDPLSFTLEATGIHGLTATNSVAQGNSITIASEHRNVQVNLAGLHGISVNINFISGDSYFGAISSSNIGGTNNVNTSAPYCVIASSSSTANLFPI
ncbi:hypothetical protein EYR36_001879 [Pleurotus pulmonarius]|nr:hypothetical protein EYR36_001879 [Pleurotus pulmonarius]KAF4588366.1 hypothetical protein EYR38_010334 [Pleurotus pulmonarius]